MLKLADDGENTLSSPRYFWPLRDNDADPEFTGTSFAASGWTRPLERKSRYEREDTKGKPGSGSEVCVVNRAVMKFGVSENHLYEPPRTVGRSCDPNVCISTWIIINDKDSWVKIDFCGTAGERKEWVKKTCMRTQTTHIMTLDNIEFPLKLLD